MGHSPPPTDSRLLSALAEKQRRERRKLFTAEGLLFPEQRKLADDRSRWIVACCSRRAGKTEAAAFALLEAALRVPSCNVVYITLVLKVAHRNLWPRLLEFNERYALGGKANQARLMLSMPNGSVISVVGCSDIAEADKLRGVPRLYLAWCDEFQSFREEVAVYLLREILEPGLLDISGSRLVLSGSPGPVPSGYFHAAATGENSKWSKHAFTIWQNPYLGHDPAEYIKELAEEKGLDPTLDPWIRRNYFNEWVIDSQSLLFPWSAEKNDIDPKDIVREGLTYFVGVDLGVNDADSIFVWGVRGRTAYRIEDFTQRGQSHDEIVSQIKQVNATYSPVVIAADPSAGGARIIQDLSRVHSIPIEAADKQERVAAIGLFADALRTGRIKIPSTSRWVKDSMKLEWMPEARGLREKKSGFHSDVLDAGLYGWRAASKYFTMEEPIEVRAKLTVGEVWERRWAEYDERQEAARDEDWALRDWVKG